MPKRLGILGGGQLARLTTLAARTAGLDVIIYDPDPCCCAGAVATRVVTGAWSDLDRVRAFASMCDVVTLDREDVPIASLAMASVAAEVFPSPEVMTKIANKLEQKEWLRRGGFPVAPFHRIADAQVPRFPGFLKAPAGTFDGRGVVEIKSAIEFANFQSRGNWYFEEKVPFVQEISVLVARSFSGETVVYAPAVNRHLGHVLDTSVLGATLDPAINTEAQLLATEIALGLGVVGLLVVEMFVTAEGRLIVNELAPRPHNSYHGSERAYSVSQFEQLVRVGSGHRLEQPELLRPTAIANLLGDVWAHGEPAWDKALAVPGVSLHLYGKGHPAPRRKMGHLSAIGSTATEALERVTQARTRATTITTSSNQIEGAYEHTNHCVTSA